MTKLFDQTITIKLNVKYTGDPEAFALALSRLSEDPRAVDVSGAIPCALWRVLNVQLANEGDLRVRVADPQIRRYAVDLTFTLSTKNPERVQAAMVDWADGPHGQGNDETLNLALTCAIWGNHTLTKVNCFLNSRIIHVLFSDGFTGTRTHERFTVKVSFLVEAVGNDKAEAVDYNEIYRAITGCSRYVGSQSHPPIDYALLKTLDAFLPGTVAQTELFQVTEIA